LGTTEVAVCWCSCADVQPLRLGNCAGFVRQPAQGEEQTQVCVACARALREAAQLADKGREAA
jgi:hypothetical protein